MGWLDKFVHSKTGGADADTQQLEQLGYKQELARHLNTFRNFAICFSFLSPITGLTGTFSYTWLYGGPLAIVWGWVLVTVMNLFMGLALSEMASAFPTAGGTFYWSGRMGGSRWGPFAAWIVGFFVVLGEIGCTAGVTYTSAIIIAQYVLLGRGGAGGGGTPLTQYEIVYIYIGVEILIGLLNTFSVRLLDAVGEISVWFHVVGITAFVIILPSLAPVRQPAAWVFGAFTPDSAYSGILNPGFTFLLALLGSQWAMVGYDAAAHMSEETQGAAMAGPISLIATIITGFIVGLAYVISLLFSVQDPASVLSPDNATAGGSGPMQIAWDVFSARFGSGLGALGLFVVPLLCSLFCGNACLTTCSRVVWSFSRDGDLKISRLLRQVHPKFKTPVNAVWASVLCQIIVGLPALYSYTAFAAITSIGVIGLYISYLVPLVLRVTVYRKRFVPGPFYLGPASLPVNVIALAWACLAIVLFALPQVYPTTWASLNYAPIAVLVTLVLSAVWWAVDARKWFRGPKFGYDHDGPSANDGFDEEAAAKGGASKDVDLVQAH
ncbi:MAG: amino acid/polyamine transporter I [Monoraphidium minutum]|nr:MAG: amino acid/polyamine transporter I [Monoraphidium minutum]